MTEFHFEHPFEHGGVKFDKLTAKRPSVRDMRNFFKKAAKDEDGTGAVVEALSSVCGVQEVVIQAIDWEDFLPMQKWFLDFLPNTKNDSEA